jgi:hypothetical protein
MFQNKRLSIEEIKNIDNKQYYFTNIKGVGQAVVKFLAITSYPAGGGVGYEYYAYLELYTPQGQMKESYNIKDLEGLTPYYGPIPPQFSALPGGMGGQGWGQGQTFPSQGGQGPGSWGTWGGF